MKCTWKTLLTSLACAGLLSVSNVFAHSIPQNEQGQPRWIETSWDGESLPTVLHRQPTLTKEQLSEPVTVDNFAKTYPMSTLPIASNQAGSKAQGDNIRFDDFREITHYQDMSWGTLTMLETGESLLFTQQGEVSFTVGTSNQPYYKSMTISLLDENLEVEKSFTLDVPDSTYSVSVIGTASTSFFNTDTKREIVLQVHSFTEHLSSGPAYCRDTILVVNEDGEILQKYGQASGAFLQTVGNSRQFMIAAPTYAGIQDSVEYNIYNARTEGERLFHYAIDRTLVNYTSSVAFQTLELEDSTYYVACRYEQSFVEPGDPRDPVVRADNHFIVTIYNAATFEVSKQIKIDIFGKDSHEWSMGALRHFSDIMLSKTLFDSDPDWELIYTVDRHLDECDCTQSDIYLVNEAGEMEKELFIGTGGVLKLAELPGQPDEYVVFWGTEDAITGFQMVQMPSLESTYFGTIQDGEYLSLTFERLADPDYGWQYIWSLRSGEYYQDTAAICLGYFTPQGEMSKKVRLKVGEQTVQYGVALTAENLNPYLFDDDAEREFIVMGTEESLSGEGTYYYYVAVAQEESGTLTHRVYSHPEYGDFPSAGTIPNQATDRIPAMYITFDRGGSGYGGDGLTTVFYQLPLVRDSLPGSGTEDDPYVISTPAQLDQVRNDLDAWYVLESDIDMVSWSGLNNRGFSPIAQDGFQGHFDGQGHTIRNLHINSDADYAGLFGILLGAEIRNLNIEDARLESASAIGAGIVAGAASNSAVIENCHVTGSMMDVTSGGGQAQVGGIAGGVLGAAQIRQCSFNGSISAPASNKAGGIAGLLSRSGSLIEACYSQGSILGNEYTGGIAGQANQTSSLRNCYSNMEVSGLGVIGGVVGYVSATTVDHVYATGRLSALPEAGRDAAVGGLVGQIRGMMTGEGRLSYSVAMNDTLSTTEEGSVYRISDWIINDHSASDSNFALASMLVGVAGAEAVISADDAEAVPVGSHGMSMTAEEMDEEFYASTLGWAFGESLEEPWKMEAGMPHLWFEYVVRGVSFPSETYLMYTGDVDTLQALVFPATAENQTLYWESSDPLVASVDQNGVVTARSTGTAAITVETEEGGFTAVCRITVAQPVESLTLDQSHIVIGVGEQQTLTASLQPADADNQNIHWYVTDNDILMVSNGIVMGVALGEAYVVAESEDGHASDSCLVTVAVPVERIIVDPSYLELAVGATAELNVTIRPSDATNQNVSYSSSDPAVATVEDGTVTAVAPGSAVITVSSEEDASITATCGVSVTPVSNEGSLASDCKVYVHEQILYIRAGSEIRDVQILDMQGRLMLTETLNASEGDIDLHSLSNGVYIVRLVPVSGQSLQMKFYK